MEITITDFKERIDEFYKIVFRIDLFWFDKKNDFEINLDNNCDSDIKHLLTGFNELKTRKLKIAVLEEFINLLFEKLFLFSHENNIFFNQCSFTVYESTFESRFMEYKKVYVDTKLIDFAKLEIPYLTNNTCNVMFRMLNKINKKRVSDSTKKKLDFLENKFKSLDTLLQQTEPEPFDLSDTSAVEKIIYLNELGIIDFLKTKPEFMGSTNLMATILSAITDVKASTLQTSLNRLNNNDTDDKNHPYRTKTTVERVRQTLIDKNIKPKAS